MPTEHRNLEVRLLARRHFAASIGGDGRISVTLGRAVLAGDQEDLSAIDPGIDYRFVSTGNPHCVIAVDDPDRFPLASEGPRLECHPRFPERTNVEAFVAGTPVNVVG